jgi:hypothetical protein
MKTKYLPLLFALSLLGCHSELFAADGSAAHPNVLMIVIEDLNDWEGYLGGHPQAPLLNPSRTSVLSGSRQKFSS